MVSRTKIEDKKDARKRDRSESAPNHRKKRPQKDDKDRKRARSESSSKSSDSLFRMASRSTTRDANVRLRRYAEKYPGKLTASLVQRMYRQVAVEGEAKLSKDALPAVAKAFVLRVMQTSYPAMSMRNLQDLRFLAAVLDHLVSNRVNEASDLIAQQLKVLEQVLDDSGSWERARYLSLMDLEVGKLIDKDERHAVTQEARADRKDFWSGKGAKTNQGQQPWTKQPWTTWPSNHESSTQAPKGWTQKGGKQESKGKRNGKGGGKGPKGKHI